MNKGPQDDILTLPMIPFVQSDSDRHILLSGGLVQRPVPGGPRLPQACAECPTQDSHSIQLSQQDPVHAEHLNVQPELWAGDGCQEPTVPAGHQPSTPNEQGVSVHRGDSTPNEQSRLDTAIIAMTQLGVVNPHRIRQDSDIPIVAICLAEHASERGSTARRFGL